MSDPTAYVDLPIIRGFIAKFSRSSQGKSHMFPGGAARDVGEPLYVGECQERRLRNQIIRTDDEWESHKGNTRIYGEAGS